MIAFVDITLRHDAYSKTEICEILELSNEEELFAICQMSDHVKKYQHFELYKRAMHVFGEAKRVYDFKAVCDKETTASCDSHPVKGTANGHKVNHNCCSEKTTSSSLERLGELMFASHKSCADMYECSHPQLDLLVDLSRKHGALGARYLNIIIYYSTD